MKETNNKEQAIEDESEEDSASSPETETKKEPEINLSLRLKLRRKYLYYILLPLLGLLLLTIGLFRQGYIGAWITGEASIRIVVTDEANQPIELASVIVGEVTTPTDKNGVASVGGLPPGRTNLQVRRTGFEAFSREINLRRGSNDLGQIRLTPTPEERVSFSLRVQDYVTEEFLSQAIISLNDIRPILENESWSFNDVPLGEYMLSVSLSGYNPYEVPIIVIKETIELEIVNLVPIGRVVFESNRERGLRGVFTANYDGSDQRPLVPRVGETEDFAPVLSPNQRQVFFFSTRESRKQTSDTPTKANIGLFFVDIDGTNLRLIDADVFDSGPMEGRLRASARWSDSGRFIGYVNAQTQPRLYDVITNRRIEISGYRLTYNIRISPNDNLFAMAAVAENSPDFSSNVFIGRTDGTGIRDIGRVVANFLEFTHENRLRYVTITNNRETTVEYDYATEQKRTVAAMRFDRSSGQLSPDRTRRAYVATRDGKTNLFVSSVDGAAEKQLTNLNFVSYDDLLWSRDGRFIMFTVSMPGETARYLVSSEGLANPKKIVDINKSF